MRLNVLIYFVLLVIVVSGCRNSPKVIQSINDKEQRATVPIQSTGIFSTEDADSPIDNPGISTDTDGMHNVKAIEVLQATKYVYVKVKEGDAEYWIATTKQEVNVNENYFYRGGLLKTNFESKEHNRIFDRIYLVSRIIPTDHGSQGNMANNESEIDITASDENKSIDLIKMEGSITIKELLDNLAKYDGQVVQISARCVKVNPNIMGRNWVHLEDGTQGNFDMVATTDIPIPEGNVVTLKGTINLDVDFGAGYRYEVIMEEATVLKMQ